MHHPQRGLQSKPQEPHREARPGATVKSIGEHPAPSRVNEPPPAWSIEQQLGDITPVTVGLDRLSALPINLADTRCRYRLIGIDISIISIRIGISYNLMIRVGIVSVWLQF